MKTREKFIAFFMAVIFIFWVSSLFKKPEKKKMEKSHVPSLQRTPSPTGKEKEDAQAKEKVPEVDLQGIIAYIEMKYAEPTQKEFKDPFEKLDPKLVLDMTAVDFTELELSGIIWEEKDPVTLINDQILRKGDMISGFKIYTIRRNEVVLIKGLERYILKLPNPVKDME